MMTLARNQPKKIDDNAGTIDEEDGYKACDGAYIFNCGICYEDYDLNELDSKGEPLYEIKMLDKCNHTFCSECFKETFRTLIEDQNRSHDIRCPQVGCGQKASEEEIARIISEDSYTKYKKFQNNKKVQMDKNLFFCPTRDCEEVLDKRKAVSKTKLISCSKCHRQICSQC